MGVACGDAFGLVFLRLPGGDTLDDYFAALELAAPLLQGADWERSVTGWYANCARENQLRISYFTRQGDAPRELAAGFAARAGLELAAAPAPPGPIAVAAAYGGEEPRFRRFLAGFPPVALDLMLADRVHARRLVATMRWQVTRPRGSLRAHLEPACLAFSTRYRRLSPAARTRFWRDLAHWPNPPQVDWAHMLVNMVLGFDWPPAAFLTPAPALDVEAINERLAACPGALTIPPGWRPDPSARGPRIRRAGAGDAAAVAAFGARTFAAAFGADNRPEDMRAYLETSFDRARITGELADADTFFLLAEDGDELVGYAMLKRGPAPAALAPERSIEIVRIYAATARIGQGCGSALMAACLDEARDRGCDSVWLGVWERNERAIGFYRRWGFEVIGSHDFVLGSDVQNDLIMARRLDAPG